VTEADRESLLIPKEWCMPSVYYILEKQTVEADPAETILQASLRVGIPVYLT
jgi:ferredoxin